ncbi:sirohydrochlorin chelatase [Lipingzhangella sp. LS1_29]|uniref:Sirohydrochlorin chelatase n=1 Tax=Lipingzhangella rawalii TaxID=2055835 RepID=A0ABU2H0P8_9ACTN|nr:sirohydrochlorin chelatase [Lipingzhangella rawalii]MDS1268871.1 sirohydrochlorin chelatase [Lipingzhangella rawalii]
MRNPPVTTRDHPTPLVAVAHGSTDPRSAAAVHGLVSRMRTRRPELDIRCAYLDHVSPDPFHTISDLAASGAGEVVVAPVLLTSAYHSKVDLPQVLERVQHTYPWLRLRYADTLGPHALLLDAVERRLIRSGVSASPDTAVVLAAAGSSDPAANQVIRDLATALEARAGWHSVTAAYASATEPGPAEAVTAAYERGARRVVTATYLLAPGFFSDRIERQARSAGAWTTTPTLGDCPELAELALLRYDEARSLAGRIGAPQ